MRVNWRNKPRKSLGKATWCIQSGSMMSPSSLGRWSRWAYRRSWTGISHAIGATGAHWGWTAVIWLASIVTEGNHRKVSVETYLKGMRHTLSHLTARLSSRWILVTTG